MAIDYIIFENGTSNYQLAKYTKNLTTKFLYKFCNQNKKLKTNYEYYKIKLNNTDIANFSNIEELKKQNNIQNNVICLKFVDDEINVNLKNFKETKEKIKNSQEKIKISLVNLTGKVYEIECIKNISVLELKFLYQEVTGIPYCEQKFVYCGKVLEDDKILFNDYRISHDARMHVILRLRGGMFMETTSGNIDYKKINFDKVDFDFDLDLDFKEENEENE
jgi:hypothetical protein